MIVPTSQFTDASGDDGSLPVFLQAAPLVRKVRRYLCPFCLKSRAKEAPIRRHMAWCIYNPAAKSCLTCLYYCPAEREEYDYLAMALVHPGSRERCGEGIQWPHDQPKPRQCPKWEFSEESRGRGPGVTSDGDEAPGRNQ